MSRQLRGDRFVWCLWAGVEVGAGDADLSHVFPKDGHCLLRPHFFNSEFLGATPGD
jgi:hypothetical protein